MSLHRANGTRVTTATVDSLVTPIVDPDPLVTVNERLVVRTEYSGGNDATAATGDDRVATAFQAGQVVRKSQIVALLTKAAVKTLSPVSGAAAGGTAVTIVGEGLDGVTGVSFGGVAATSVVVVNPRLVTCVAPAHAAGLVNVVLTDDGGAVTKTGAFTYTS